MTTVSIQDKIKIWRAEVLSCLQEAQFGESPEYLTAPMQYALESQGKMLRSALCLAATEAVGGEWQQAVRLGAVLEIFHTFTLVHDDIMDGDELRRGKPTVHKAFDKNRALLSGDTLLIYVYQLLSRVESGDLERLHRVFNQGAMDVCNGQGMDMEFEDRQDVTPEEYERMIDLKTGALIRLACELGGIQGGGTSETVEALARFGVLLGRAFQMQDDLLELTSSTETMGKSLGSDILNEKKTWIWLDLRSHLSDRQLQEWRAMKADGKDEEVIGEARAWMNEYGTLDRAKALVDGWIAEADDILKAPMFQDTSSLAALSHRILKRVN